MPTFAVTLFVICMASQMTVLPETMGAGLLSRIVNAALLVYLVVAGAAVLTRPHAPAVWAFYVWPFALLLVCYGFNIGRALGPNTLGLMGHLLPWGAALTIPFLRSYSLDAAWRVFYRFMYLFSVVALVEYYAMFEGMLGNLTVLTDGGLFLKGFFTIFFMDAEGLPHYRLYGVFPEPGTYAMFLIPAIVYALVYRRWLALLVFGACLFLTDSLGGFASAAVAGIVFVLRQRRSWAVRLLLAAVVSVGVWQASSAFFVTTYEDRGASATARERNVTGFVTGLGAQLAAYPFGAALNTGGSISALGAFDSSFLGLNFSPYVVLVFGGIFALLGYLMLLLGVTGITIKELMRGVGAQSATACVFVSCPAMLLFVFQRETVFETTIFAFLYAWPVLNSLRGGAAPSGASGGEQS